MFKASLCNFCRLFLGNVGNAARVGLLLERRLKIIGLFMVEAVGEQHLDGEVLTQGATKIVCHRAEEYNCAHENQH